MASAGPPPRRDPARARRITHRLSTAALGVLLCICGISRWLAEDQWWSTLLLYLPQLGYALLVAPLFLVALWQRHRPALLVNGAALALIAGPMMGLHLPALRFRPPARAPEVRVLAYNILGGHADFPRLRAQVARYRPDVVVLSEARHYRNEQRLRQELARMFPGWPHVRGGDVYVASRWPLVAQATAPLGEPTRDPSTDRRIVHAEFAGPTGRFHVVGVHFRTAAYGQTLLANWRRLDRYLRHTGRVRQSQAAATLRYLDTLEGPVLLCGDFNTPPEGHIYTRITRRLADAFAAAGPGWGHTYPSAFPLLRIDYIFHSRHWSVNRFETGPAPGSDHRPIFAELSLNDVR